MLTERVVNVQVVESIKKLRLSIYRPGLPIEDRLVHIPPQPKQSQKLEARIYRNMLKVRVPGKHPEWLREIRRGAVSLDFAGKKRKRMLDKFNAWRFRCQNAVFIHLTYPSEYPLNWRLWKLNLKEFKRLLMKRFPAAEGMWKLELQKRGAPHFHIILDLRSRCRIDRLRQWCDAAWARIAHQDDVYQGKYAVRVEPIFSIRHALNYAAKYCGKVQLAPLKDDQTPLTAADLGDTMGRQWGVIGKPDFSEGERFTLSREHLTLLQMSLAKQLKLRGAKGWRALARPAFHGSFTVYGIGDNSDDRFDLAMPTLLKIEASIFTCDNPAAEVWKIERELEVGYTGCGGVIRERQQNERIEWYAAGEGDTMLPGYPKYMRA